MTKHRAVPERVIAALDGDYCRVTLEAASTAYESALREFVQRLMDIHEMGKSQEALDKFYSVIRNRRGDKPKKSVDTP